MSQSEYYSIQKECDVGLFTLHKSHVTHNFPGKLLGYMAQGIPTLGSVNPGNDLISIIHKHKAGLVSINGDDDDFLLNCKKLVLDINITVTHINSIILIIKIG